MPLIACASPKCAAAAIFVSDASAWTVEMKLSGRATITKLAAGSSAPPEGPVHSRATAGVARGIARTWAKSYDKISVRGEARGRTHTQMNNWKKMAAIMALAAGRSTVV